MAQRNRKPSGLDYKMRPNPGARQPSGPAPAALNFLRDGGGLAEEPSPSTDDPANHDPQLTLDPESETKPPPNLTIAPDPVRRPKKKGRRTGAPRSAKSEAYSLPPNHKRQPSRSNHFRLPADVEAHLRELASEYECSRTHVVCSVLSAEWQRLKRRQNRATKTVPDA